ncbi:DUF2786 domain-containing protein [Nocardia sp. NPDC058379]|uniref:DUF2786 domain-containing protein n=1 Tax=unclassified Nocardia TaxID=2637762 RepID=UPI0036475C64
MGKQNRRRRTGRRAVPATGPVLDADTLTDPERLAEAIATAAVAAAQGDTAGARHFAEQLAGPDRLRPEVAAGVERASRRIIAHAFDFGWLPSDVHQAARRRLDEFAVGYLTDLMADHRAPFADDTVDEIWQAQLDDLGATVWWTPPHLIPWADRALLTGADAVTTVLDALALLLRLPKLEPIRPLPGTAHRHRGAQPAVDEKALGRVRGLLAKAESTAFPEEAETLSAKAQELMTKYAIDRVLLAAPTVDVDLPGARRLWLDTPYTEAKALLIDLVARANRCRAIFVADWDFVTVVGDDPDLDAVELLSTSLLVQATRAMIDTPSTAGDSRSRAYRKAFLTAYASRIGDRLTTAAAATVAEAADRATLLPLLATHDHRVETALSTYFPTTRSRGITIRSAEGWEAGTEAADRARLDG